MWKIEPYPAPTFFGDKCLPKAIRIAKIKTPSKDFILRIIYPKPSDIKALFEVEVKKDIDYIRSETKMEINTLDENFPEDDSRLVLMEIPDCVHDDNEFEEYNDWCLIRLEVEDYIENGFKGGGINGRDLYTVFKGRGFSSNEVDQRVITKILNYRDKLREK